MCDWKMWSLCQPTNELLNTRVLSSSVVKELNWCLEGGRFNAHVELGKLFLSSFLHNIVLCIKTEEPNEEKYGRSVWGNDEKHSRLLKNICKKKSSSSTDDFRKLWESKHLVKIAVNLNTHVAYIPVQFFRLFSSFSREKSTVVK